MYDDQRLAGVRGEVRAIVNANVNMHAHSQQNPFQRWMLKASVGKAKKYCAWHISDDDHTFRMEESRNREEFNEYGFSINIR